jgi:hypothetical protein
MGIAGDDQEGNGARGRPGLLGALSRRPQPFHYAGSGANDVQLAGTRDAGRVKCPQCPVANVPRSRFSTDLGTSTTGFGGQQTKVACFGKPWGADHRAGNVPYWTNRQSHAQNAYNVLRQRQCLRRPPPKTWTTTARARHCGSGSPARLNSVAKSPALANIGRPPRHEERAIFVAGRRGVARSSSA